MSKITLPELAPGSEPAIRNGCICAVLDNHHGKGANGQPGVYWITAGCPVHTPEWMDVVPAPPHTTADRSKL